ncbi:MAG TPA: ATP-binding protein [Aquabacterium sp.]|nr:ATP-binding protein [Aquabacterium sp.]
MPRTRDDEATEHTPLNEGAHSVPDRQADSSNLLQLIEMRWLAVAGQFLTILIVRYALDIELPVVEMITLLGVLATFNIVSWWRGGLSLPVSNGELFVGLLVDVAVLTGQLYYSGGSANPFIYLYLLQVVLGSVLLRPRYTWAIVAATSLCFVGLTQWHQPLALATTEGHLPSTDYVGGLLICFLLNASLLVIFIGRIGRNLRRRDARLADLRQRAAEEEHIVRIGLLASGAAHELGTPLATLSVILGDWARMTPFAAEPELREELEQMQVQVARCKAIVTGILLSAGETRGDHPEATTLHDFLDELTSEWCQTRPVKDFQFDRKGLPDVPIISDTALRQMVDNILDNALEAGPQGRVSLIARCEDDTLILRVLDEGPGFSAYMLQRFGKPYESSKGRPGGGLGLFLSTNVARTLGGTIQAHNRPGSGAEVVITLPLSTLMPSE